jgi:hypothetical protein
MGALVLAALIGGGGLGEGGLHGEVVKMKVNRESARR